MPLIKCHECQKEISDTAKTCPNCGAKPIPPKPPKKPMGNITKTIIIFFGFISIVSLLLPKDQVNTPPVTAATTSSAPITTSAPSAPITLWQYATNQDDMTGKPINYAQLLSLNSNDLAFPYGPGINATLDLRKHPRYGKDIYLTINKGQILCNSYDGCSVLIRFDDRGPVKFSAIGPSDNSTNTIFIHNYKKLIAEIKRSKLMKIELPIYQDGNLTWQFKVDGLKWETK